jgi:hypothetical protein
LAVQDCSLGELASQLFLNVSNIDQDSGNQESMLVPSPLRIGLYR